MPVHCILILWSIFQINCISEDSDLESTENYNIVKLNNQFIPSSEKFPIEAINIFLVNLHKIKFDFNCRDVLSKCEEIFQSHRFYAIMADPQKTRFLLKISYHGSCLGEKVSPLQIAYHQLKLELPLDIKSPDGFEYGFHTTSKIVYEVHQNLYEEEIKATLPDENISLILTEQEREVFRQTVIDRGTFQCVNTPQYIPILDLSTDGIKHNSKCTSFQGKVLLVNKMMVRFVDVDYTQDSKDNLVGSINDLQFYFYGTDSKGNKLSNIAMKYSNNPLQYKGTSLTEYVYLPRSMTIDNLVGLNITTDFEENCHFQIKRKIKKKASESVEGVPYNVPKLSPEKAAEECKTIPPLIHGEYVLSDDYRIGSVVAIMCNSGYNLVPSDYKSECRVKSGIAVWESNNEHVKCKQRGIKEYCEDDYCDNEGKCKVIKGEAVCECFQPFSGMYCEIDNDPCKNNKCINGACLPENNFTSYRCLCEEGFIGDFCESSAEIKKYCGTHGKFVIMDKNQKNFECKCATGYYANINEPCTKSNQVFLGGCPLEDIPNGNYINLKDPSKKYILVDKTVQFECLEGYYQMVTSLVCMGDMKLSKDVNELCIEYTEITIKEKKINVWMYFTVSFFSLVVMLLLGMFIIRLFHKEEINE